MLSILILSGAHYDLSHSLPPLQMLNHLYCQDGDLITVQNVSLKLATFSKFQPQTVDFLDITNPKAVYPPFNNKIKIDNRVFL